MATLKTPINLFKGKIYEISGSQHTQKSNNRKETGVKKNESHRQREWEEEARKPHKDFHLLQLKENITLKTSRFFSTFIPSYFYNQNVTFLMLKRMLLICVAIVPNLTFLIYQLTYLLTILLKLFQFISVPYFALRQADECIHYTLLDRLSGFYCFHWLCFQ